MFITIRKINCIDFYGKSKHKQNNTFNMYRTDKSSGN